jgi:hypothetical protein
MLSSVLKILKQQKKVLKTVEEKQAYRSGYDTFKKYYCSLLHKELLSGEKPLRSHQILALLRYEPMQILQLIKIRYLNVEKNVKKDPS